METESLRAMLLIAGTVFVAELADKTQLATLAFASSSSLSKIQVWIAASLGLVVAAGVAVLAAHLVGPLLKSVDMTRVGGIMFVAIGAWMIVRG